MRVHLRGVRGSIPTSGPDTAHYGGNTSCTDVWEDGWVLVLDGGSGIRNADAGVDAFHNRVDILLTHLHLDHIQGLGFYSPLFNPSMEVHIWGPSSSAQTLRSRLGRYLSPPLFPVHLRDLPCRLNLHEIENSIFRIGPFTIQSCYVIHPGPTVGYRITGHQSVFTYIPDHEPAMGLDGIHHDPKWISGFDLAREADLLLHDAQYSSAEYKDRIGWGHSSMDDAVLFASLAGARHVLLSHHDPSNTDQKLESLFSSLQERKEIPFEIELAVEGREIHLP